MAGREDGHITIVGSTIEDNSWDGVALYRGATARIVDNVIRRGNGAGVGITWDSRATVINNRVSGYWKGIGTFGASEAIVHNNFVFDGKAAEIKKGGYHLQPGKVRQTTEAKGGAMFFQVADGPFDLVPVDEKGQPLPPAAN